MGRTFCRRVVAESSQIVHLYTTCWQLYNYFWYLLCSLVLLLLLLLLLTCCFTLFHILLVWEMVKAALKKYFGPRQAELVKFVHKYKPQMLDLLQRLKKHMEFQFKGLAIDFLSDIIKIILQWGEDNQQLFQSKERASTFSYFKRLFQN